MFNFNGLSVNAMLAPGHGWVITVYDIKDVNICLNLWLNESTRRLLLVDVFKFTPYSFGHVMSQCNSTRYSLNHSSDKGRSLIKLLTLTRHPIQVCCDVTFEYLEDTCYVWRLLLRQLLNVYKANRAGVIWVVFTLICVRKWVFSNIFNNFMYHTVSVQVQLWYLSFSDN